MVNNQQLRRLKKHRPNDKVAMLKRDSAEVQWLYVVYIPYIYYSISCDVIKYDTWHKEYEIFMGKNVMASRVCVQGSNKLK